MRRLLQGRPMGRVLRILLFVLLLAILLILLVLNQRRETIATGLWYVIWLGNLLYKAVPQGAYWVLFLLVALVITATSL
jgi:hypothetical protein